MPAQAVLVPIVGAIARSLGTKAVAGAATRMGASAATSQMAGRIGGNLASTAAKAVVGSGGGGGGGSTGGGSTGGGGSAFAANAGYAPSDLIGDMRAPIRSGEHRANG